jgi:hypothetical protein
VNVKKIEIVINDQLIKIIYLLQDLKLATSVAVDKLAERRYWVTGDGLTNTILVTEKRCLDIRAEP